MPKKALLIYAVVCAALMLILNAGKFSVFGGHLRFESYIILAGIVFTFFGIFLGMQWITSKQRKTTRLQVKKQHNYAKLSPREMEVLQLMAEGLANQEIADKLFVSLPTVKTHASNIYQKMDVKRRTQAVQEALQSGLISPHTKD